jgi:predicted nucleotidyltransferase
LNFEEYLWHERRKLNKALIAGTKFDITLLAAEAHAFADTKRKFGARTIRARVRDAAGAFDYPARYTLDHAEIGEALAFTHTYAGQAESGEVVEIAGTVEETGAGALRIVIGSSREAPGEFIKVAGAQERHS